MPTASGSTTASPASTPRSWERAGSISPEGYGKSRKSPVTGGKEAALAGRNTSAIGRSMSDHLTLQHIIDQQTALLAELRRRQAVVRDYVRGVARQYATGLYLFGRPGTA